MATTNAELARLFEEMSEVLEILGENRFKVIAHHNVARVLRDLSTDVATLVDDKKKLTAIDGIGDGTANRIIEYVETGRIEEHDELLKKVPAGLLEVIQIPGLGPKTVKLMWEQADVVDIPSLKRALDAGAIAQLPRMGEKTVENIRESLAFMETSAKRTRLGTALPVAEMIVEHLKRVEGIRQIQYAGSLRRGRETIGDIDILASTADPKALVKAFTSMDDVSKVLASGETKTSLRLDSGMQVDLRIVDDSCFGAALLYFTGSKEHNIALRERAIRKSLRLNEYGLFRAEDFDEKSESPRKSSVTPVAAKTEEDVYKALKLKWMPPEVRENSGEFDHDFSNLITIDDIRAELHAHTTASDGFLSINELIEEARSRGFHTLAITDHSRSSVQANGLDPDRLRRHIEAIHAAAKEYDDITVLAGSEVDILTDGRLDYDDDLLAELDFIVASPHAALSQDAKKATARLLKAIEHPLVRVLGHPTGRLISRRDGLSPDINALIEHAIEHDTALEINANSYRLDLRDTHVRAAVERGALIAINTDAHSVKDFDQLRYGIMTARRGWLEPEQCINTWSKSRLHKWIRAKR